MIIFLMFYNILNKKYIILNSENVLRVKIYNFKNKKNSNIIQLYIKRSECDLFPFFPPFLEA